MSTYLFIGKELSTNEKLTNSIKTPSGLFNSNFIPNISRVGFIWKNNGTRAPFGSTNFLINNQTSSIFFKEFVDFISQYQTLTVDLITCNFKLDDFKYNINYLKQLYPNITINYSFNYTGNSPNGDWIMETSGENISPLYFNENILLFSELLDVTPLPTNNIYHIDPKNRVYFKYYNQTYNVLDPIGSTVLIANGPGNDDVSSNVHNIGFDFDYLGTTYNTFSVTTNGIMTFGNTSNSPSPANEVLSNLTFPCLMPFWDDLDVNFTNCQIYYKSTANDLIIEFAVILKGRTIPINFQIKLVKNEYKIYYNYRINNGASGFRYTVGLFNDNNLYYTFDSSANKFYLENYLSANDKTLLNKTIEILQNPTNVAEFDLTNLDLSGVDLSGFDLTGFDLSSINLTNADLRYANLTNTKTSYFINYGGMRVPNGFRDVSYNNVNFILGTNVNLSGSIINNVDFTGIDLTGSNLTSFQAMTSVEPLSIVLPIGYRVVKAGSNNYFIAGPRVNLSNLDITGSDLSGIDLSNVNLTNVSLENCNLDRVNLKNAIFSDTITGPFISIIDPILSTKYSIVKNTSDDKYIVGPNINLTGIDTTLYFLKQVDIQNLTIPSTSTVSFSNMYESKLVGCTIKNNLIDNISFIRSDLSGTTFEDCTFQSVLIIKANLTNTNLTNCKFIDCIIRDSNWSDIINTGTITFVNTKLDGKIRNDTQ